ncbi:ABC transporter ATP-binding protein [Paenibacillus thermoaerophilus]|uniref:ABC transporter ATP-binding protein n=1 Tax=Paenibacillus thermoaerophilus TaxID=1215385 RepID=A0ABW2V3D8_9BACL|nr:ABC transporter ATP-binding protein [Paenibacillus thermoaerophilus]TMV18470.1 ABC transporter ATP-binding protein [Paenibacillus thermoaerophilus]
MADLLRVEKLTGGYSSAKPVLREVSFEVRAGEMVGLIGLNGAGKSTAIKHILGLLLPHAGEIRVGGRTLAEAPDTYRAGMAYVPETPLLYEELTVREHLRLAAMAYGLEEAAFAERADELAESFDMRRALDRLPSQLSKGMRQRVMMMTALLVRPSLYVIDEPFLGLDPLGVRTLLDWMAARKREGAGLLVCSHLLTTLEAYCDRFVLLADGRVRAAGSLDDLREAAGMRRGAGSLDEAFFRLIGGGPA